MNGKIELDIIAILGWFLTAICGIVIWYLKVLITRDRKAQEEKRLAQSREIEGIKRELKEGDDRMTEIENNYIARFEEVTNTIHNTREVLLTAIGDLKSFMSQTFVTKEDCRLVQSLGTHRKEG